MNNQLIEVVAKLRIAVGFLGEQEHHRWWASHFFDEASKVFLEPIFHRTRLLTQYHGVVQAASRVHDEHIGVGQVYHLFRLPEDLEHGVHTAFHRESVVKYLSSVLVGGSPAMKSFLEMTAVKPARNGEGPVRMGTVGSIRTLPAWSAVAGIYLWAFRKELRVFPYFSDPQ